eukprot:scaffold1023_cov313-Pinguiococcus_pyrenoidosus.AAC.11
MGEEASNSNSTRSSPFFGSALGWTWRTLRTFADLRTSADFADFCGLGTLFDELHCVTSGPLNPKRNGAEGSKQQNNKTTTQQNKNNPENQKTKRSDVEHPSRRNAALPHVGLPRSAGRPVPTFGVCLEEGPTGAECVSSHVVQVEALPGPQRRLRRRQPGPFGLRLGQAGAQAVSADAAQWRQVRHGPEVDSQPRGAGALAGAAPQPPGQPGHHEPPRLLAEVAGRWRGPGAAHGPGTGVWLRGRPAAHRRRQGLRRQAGDLPVQQRLAASRGLQVPLPLPIRGALPLRPGLLPRALGRGLGSRDAAVRLSRPPAPEAHFPGALQAAGVPAALLRPSSLCGVRRHEPHTAHEAREGGGHGARGQHPASPEALRGLHAAGRQPAHGPGRRLRGRRGRVHLQPVVPLRRGHLPHHRLQQHGLRPEGGAHVAEPEAAAATTSRAVGSCWGFNKEGGRYGWARLGGWEMHPQSLPREAPEKAAAMFWGEERRINRLPSFSISA